MMIKVKPDLMCVSFGQPLATMDARVKDLCLNAGWEILVSIMDFWPCVETFVDQFSSNKKLKKALLTKIKQEASINNLARVQELWNVCKTKEIFTRMTTSAGSVE